MKNKTIPTFTKERKFTLMRRYTLIVAGLPGMILIPLLLAITLNSFSLPKMIKDAVTGLLTILTMGSLMPGILVMVALVILAIITATQKPTDPEAETPKTKLIQIIIGATAATMPTIAFLDIFRNSFKECVSNCFIFNAPTVPATGVAYSILWITLGIVWIKTKRAKPIA